MIRLIGAGIHASQKLTSLEEFLDVVGPGLTVRTVSLAEETLATLTQLATLDVALFLHDPSRLKKSALEVVAGLAEPGLELGIAFDVGVDETVKLSQH